MSPLETEELVVAAFSPPGVMHLSGRDGLWRLSPASGRGPRVGVAIRGAWASLESDAEPARCAAPLDALSDQSRWPGGVKYVDSQTRPTLRADVPLLGGTAAGRAWIGRQLRAAAEGMMVAAVRDASPAVPAQDTAPPVDPEFLAFACTAGGWNAAVKPDGTVRIDLRIRGAQRVLTLHARDAEVRASVALATGAAGRFRESCRSAAVFLMKASGALRWARAFARHEGDRLEAVGFECLLVAPPDDQALLAAVDVLIAGCEHFGREAEVLLEHPEIAALYDRHVPGLPHAAGGCRLTDVAAPGAATPSPAARAALA